MRASLADLTLWEVKFRDPRDRAAARELDVEEEVEGRSGRVLVEELVGSDETLWEGPCRGAVCRRNCKALARAFSCVRTNVASCWEC